VVLPAVPGTAQDLAGPAVDVFAGHSRPQRSGQAAGAERSSLMRAAVPQCEELTRDIEHTDRLPIDFDDLPTARRNLVDGPNDVLWHLSPITGFRGIRLVRRAPWRYRPGWPDEALDRARAAPLRRARRSPSVGSRSRTSADRSCPAAREAR